MGQRNRIRNPQFAIRNYFGVLACPECGGRLRLLATIDEPAVIEKILRHLGLPVDPPAPAPARTPAWLSSTLPNFDGAAEPAGLWSH
jgi:uncharacterized protein YbaR (Trm112 family)